MVINLPESISIRVQARNETSPVATITTAAIGPDLAAAIFDYGLRQIIRDAAANGGEKGMAAAMARAEAISKGLDWRTRAAGESTDSLTTETRKLAEAKVKAAKPQGTKMPEWLANPKVKAKIAEIMGREETIEQARKIIALRASVPMDMDLDSL